MPDPLPFVPSSRPFGDFLLVRGSGAEALDEAMRDAGGVRAPLSPGLTLYTFGFILPEQRQERFTILLGTARLGSGLSVGPQVLAAGQAPDPGSEVIGQCLGIEVDAGAQPGPRVRVFSDFLGMAPLYYREGAGGLLLSNRLQLIAQALRALGAPASLDPAAAGAIIYNSKAFWEQASVRRTPVADVLLSRPEEYFEVRADGHRVLSRPEVPYAQIGPAEYHHLIEQGAAEVAANVAAALDCPDFDQTIATLTGGRDSRMILAALFHLGRIKDTPFVTMDIDPADVAVASGLVQFFGGRYASEPAEGYEVVGAQQALTRHASIFYGLYHPIRFRNAVVRVPPRRSLRMIGGCGEIYRSHYKHSFLGALHSVPAGASRARELFRRYTNLPHIPEAWRDRVADVYAAEFETLAGDTFDAKLDAHYIRFRNRFHFGVTATYRRHDNVWHPLASPSLLRAARGLPEKLRKQGQVVFDVTRELCEIAPFLPYDTPTAARTPSPYSRPSKYEAMTLSLSPSPELVRQAVRDARAASPPPPIPQAAGRSFNAAITEANEANFAYVRSHGGAVAELLSDDLLAELRRLRKSDFKRYERWYSRLAGMADVLALA